MRIHLISDLHLDTWRSTPVFDVQADVSVVLGDIHERLEGLPFIQQLAEQRPVIVVLGNHEFYGASIESVRAKWRHAASYIENLIVLDDSVWEHQGVRFIGSTLWTDYDRESPAKMIQAIGAVKDYMYIDNKEGNDRILPAELLELHKASRRFIQDELEKPFDGKTVVLTHHAPTLSSTDPKYAGHYLNFLFGSDLDSVFAYQEFDVWAHGHMHNSSDYEHFGKRVLNNPRGSSHFPNEAFDPNFVFTV